MRGGCLALRTANRNCHKKMTAACQSVARPFIELVADNLDKDSMLQGGHLLTHLGDAGRVDFSDRNPDLCAHIIENNSPGVDNHSVTVGLSAAVVEASLGRGDNVAGIFDRPRLEEYLPVIFTREGRKSRRNHQYLGTHLR